VASTLANLSSVLATRRIGMCVYTVVPEDGRTCQKNIRRSGSADKTVLMVVVVVVGMVQCSFLVICTSQVGAA